MDIEEVSTLIDEIVLLLDVEKDSLPDQVKDLNTDAVMYLHEQIIKKFNNLRLKARTLRTQNIERQKKIGETIDNQFNATKLFALDLNPRVPKDQKTDELSDKLLQGRKNIISKSIEKLKEAKIELLALKQQTL